MFCAACGAANEVGGRFCASCGAGLAGRCASCGASLPAGARFCPACGQPSAAEPEPKPPARETPRVSTSERKQVTVLFADFSGFTAFSDKLDAEDVHDHMNAVWARLDAVITSHGGTIEKHMGDAILALFGDRQAREDDPERAVRVALAMQAALAEMPPQGTLPPLQLRVGIHTGLVVLGTVGVAGEFAAVGDTVNLASRLQQNAPEGGILISQDTYRHVFGLFDVHAQSPLAVKGKPEPVQAYLVLAAKPRGLARQVRGVAGIETAMVGRERELQQLQAALQSVLDQKKLRILTVVGDAGIGKSRLMRELQHWIELLPEVVLFFSGRATPEMADIPFSLIRDVFAQRFEIQESDSAAQAREKLENGLMSFVEEPGAAPVSAANVQAAAHAIGQLLGLDFSASPHLYHILHDPEQVRQRAFRALSRFFGASRGLRRPSGTAYSHGTLLFLEDLHWGDQGTLDLVDHLARTCQDAPLMILCLARPTLFERRPSWGEGPPAQTRLKLEALSRAESRQLVETILRKAPEIPHALRELVVGGAEGNPFYLEEIIQMLIDEKVILTGSEPWQIEPARLAAATLPPTLTGVLQARLDGLPPLERAVLQRASVIGRTFWDSALEHLAVTPNGGGEVAVGESPLTRTDIGEALSGLRRKELIFRRDSTAFAGTVEYTFKHELLRQVAYESVLRKVRRAYHGQVGSWLTEHGRDRVLEFAGLVAGHFEHAARAAEAAEWYGRAGQQARAGYAPANAIEFFRKALALAPPPAETAAGDLSRRMEWQDGLGEALAAQARFPEAREAYEAELKLAGQTRNFVSQVRALNGLAFLYEREGDNRRSVECAEKAETLAREAGPDIAVRRERVRALHLKGWAWYRLGDAQRVLALAEETFQLCTELKDRRGVAISLKLHGAGRLQLGQFLEADRYFAQGLALCLELDDRRNAAAMYSNRGETARLRGDLQAAEELYLKALALAREIGHRESEIIYLSNLAGARLGMRRFAEAEADLRQAIALSAAPKSCVLSETYSFLSEACLGQNKIAEAQAAAEHALALSRASENSLDLGGAWRTLGHAHAARNRQGADPAAAAAVRQCFGESLRIFQQIHAQGEQARTLRAWAEADLATGQVPEARQRLLDARALFEQLGATSEAQAINALLPKTEAPKNLTNPLE